MLLNMLLLTESLTRAAIPMLLETKLARSKEDHSRSVDIKATVNALVLPVNLTTAPSQLLLTPPTGAPTEVEFLATAEPASTMLSLPSVLLAVTGKSRTLGEQDGENLVLSDYQELETPVEFAPTQPYTQIDLTNQLSLNIIYKHIKSQ